MGILYGILGAIPSVILVLLYTSILDKYNLKDKLHDFYRDISENENIFMKILCTIILIVTIIIIIGSFILTIGSLFLFIFIQNGNWSYYILGTLICSFAELICFNIME